MKPSNAALAMIRKWESLRINAYLCPVGIPTIGYGTTVYPDGQLVKMGQTCTVDQAEAFLAHAVARFGNSISNMVHVNLTQNQFDALVSFAYNVGLGNLRSSTLLRKLNAGDYEGAAGQFERWVFGTVNGKKAKLHGLVSRRNEERDLFLGRV